MDLYEQIADEYDEVTGEADRIAPAEAFLQELRRRHPFASVLDVACGTGLHAVMLAQMGVAVTAADISRAMLDRAKRRGADAGVDVRWVQAPMQEIPGRVDGPFDAVLCLGNSLPHVLEPAELGAAVGGFAGLLAPGGVVVLGILNYARILARGERVVGVTRRGQAEYLRFYDFLDELVRFNVLTMRWTDRGCQHELAGALLRPYTRGDLDAVLGEHGLRQVEHYAGMGFEPFDEAESDALVVVARR